MTIVTAKPLTEQTPREIDEKLAVLSAATYAADLNIDRIVGNLHSALGHKRHYYGRSGKFYYQETTEDTIEAARERGDARTNFASGATFADLVRGHAEAVDNHRRALDAEQPFHAEFVRRGGWTRFFAVRGGHIHADASIVACNRRPSTDQGWHPELSGLTVEDAVAKLGPALCSKCFRSAPVEWKREKVGAAEREQRAAAKAAAEEARKADPTLITAPDGSPLRVDGDTLRTVRSAEIAAVGNLGWAVYGRHIGAPNESYAREHEGYARTIVAALAAKEGVEESVVWERVVTKALKKVRRDYGRDVEAKAAQDWKS